MNGTRTTTEDEQDRLTRAEWDSWGNVVREWGEACGEINEVRFNAVVSAIRLWGEDLSAMRQCQDEVTRANAYSHAEKDYDLKGME